MGTPRGPGAVLPAPSAPSGPHIPEAGLGSTLYRGVGAGGGAVRSLGACPKSAACATYRGPKAGPIDGAARAHQCTGGT